MKNFIYVTIGFLLSFFLFSSCSKIESSPLEEIAVSNQHLEKKPVNTCSTPATFRAVYNSYDGSFCNYFLELEDGRYIYPEPHTIPSKLNPADGMQVTTDYTEIEPVGFFPECYPSGKGEIIGVIIDCMQEIKKGGKPQHAMK